jgi:hypothetical protein
MSGRVSVESIPAVAQPTDNAVIYSPLLQDHHSKTLDIGLNGCTLSAGPLGDVRSSKFPNHSFSIALVYV